MDRTHHWVIAYESAHRFSLPSLSVVIGLHFAVVALLALAVTPLYDAPLVTLMVRVIGPEAPPQPKIAAPRAKPVMHKPALERPLLAAETPAPTAVETAPSKETPHLLPVTAPLAAAVTEPRFDAAYLDNPAPVYPALSRRMGEVGRVVLRVFVEPNGRASQIQIRTASDSPRLDQAAQDAVWHWKFVPAQRGAEAIGAWALVPIVFNLRG